MYAKLSLRNAKRSMKDYIIYIVTITLCVTIFYAFMSLSSKHYNLQIGEQYNLGNFYQIMKTATIAITAVMIFLISYVNGYMIKRRMREFGNYIMLGMEQGTVALMFFIETLVMGLGSILIGIFSGVLFSQVLTVIILKSVGCDAQFKFTLYPDTVGTTIGFFMIMFFLNGLLNVFKINRMKLIDMMNMEKRAEISSNKSQFLSSMVFILAAGIYGLSILNINNHPMYSVGGFIIGTYGLFLACTWFVTFIKEKVKSVRYKNTNLFLLGNLSFKLRSNAIAMANVSICIMVATALFFVAPAAAGWAEGYLNYRLVSDLRIVRDVGEGSEPIDFSSIKEYMKAKDYGVKDSCDLEVKLIKHPNKKGAVNAISLSDFNKLREMAGYHKIELKKGEYAAQWSGEKSYDEIEKIVDKVSTREVEGVVYKTNKDLQFNESLGEALASPGSCIFVFNDEVIVDLSIYEVQMYINANRELTFDEANELNDYIYEWFKEVRKDLEDNKGIWLRILAKEKNTIFSVATAMRLQGIYAGIILFVISLTVLALQQLGDSIQFKGRFDTIRKLGVEEKEIHKIILKEMGIYFGVPLIAGSCGVVIFLVWYMRKYYEYFQLYIGTEKIILNVVVAGGSVLVMYIAYFIACYTGIKRNISK